LVQRTEGSLKKLRFFDKQSFLVLSKTVGCFFLITEGSLKKLRFFDNRRFFMHRFAFSPTANRTKGARSEAHPCAKRKGVQEARFHYF
jgi:hypothetical protein